MEKEEWVVVESEAELAPGMMVRVHPCGACGETHTSILLRRLEPGLCEDEHGTKSIDVGWVIAGQICELCRRNWMKRNGIIKLPTILKTEMCFTNVIRDRALWKLVFIIENGATQENARKLENV